MKRNRVDLSEVASFDNLAEAVYAAVQGKRMHTDSALFFSSFEKNMSRLSLDILAGKAPSGIYRRFVIHDPKKRVIHAPCFEDRVVHHALMRLVGPVLDRALVPTTFACRTGKGNLAGVQAVQDGVRRFPWFGKVDIKSYFDSVDHDILRGILARKLKGDGLLSMIDRILGSYHTHPGKGLPIGALPSQHFANFYLDGMDRLLLEKIGVRGHARYMDDTVWWCESCSVAKNVVKKVRAWLLEHRRLNINGEGQINRCGRGITFCGFRVLPGALLLTRRKRRRYELKRKKLESDFLAGQIDSRDLQRSFSPILAITAYADRRGWLGQQLTRNPPPEC